MSRIFTTVAAIAATTLMSSVAFAGCNSGTYCNSSSSLAPLSSWSSTSTSGATYTSPSYMSSSYGSGSDYSSASSFSGNSFGGVLSSAEADATYGTGSISSAYEGGNVQMFGFSGSPTSVPGLGAGEHLQATNCPVNVYNPTGARVLGCYDVVKQVPQTNYVRVVRPVIYVRYPVATPIPVPYYVNQNVNPCGGTFASNDSRYGGFNNQGVSNGCGGFSQAQNFGGLAQTIGLGQGFSGQNFGGFGGFGGFGSPAGGLLGTGVLGNRGLLGVGALGL